MNVDPMNRGPVRSRKGSYLRKRRFRKNLFEGLENRYLLALDPLGFAQDGTETPMGISLFSKQTQLKDAFRATSDRAFAAESLQGSLENNSVTPWGRFQSLSELEANLKLALTPLDTAEFSWVPPNEHLPDDLESSSPVHLVLIDYRLNPQRMNRLANSPLVSQSGQLEQAWQAPQADGLTDVFLVGPDTPWEQINALLLSHHNLQSLQILSHASPGHLFLGGTTIGDQNADSLARDFEGWKQSFVPDADILIYGCDFAASDSGQGFIQKIASWTGTDVAASINLTGPESLGGDWNLELQTGPIEVPGLKLDNSQFSGLLSPLTFEDNWPSDQIQSSGPVILDFSKVTGNLDFTITSTGVTVGYQDQNRVSTLQLTTNSKVTIYGGFGSDTYNVLSNTLIDGISDNAGSDIVRFDVSTNLSKSSGSTMASSPGDSSVYSIDGIENFKAKSLLGMPSRIRFKTR
jgi:Domain of unknown function (DUF4347)